MDYFIHETSIVTPHFKHNYYSTLQSVQSVDNGGCWNIIVLDSSEFDREQGH